MLIWQFVQRWYIVLGLIAFVCSAIVFANHERNIGYEQARAAYELKISALNKSISDANTEALNKQLSLQKQIQEAQNEAVHRNNQISILRGQLDSSADRLRDTIASNNRKLPKATNDAKNKYTETLGVVLGECTKRYSDLAETADRQQSDIELLQKAWPKDEK